MKELERLIRGKIRLLEMLKERSVTGSEWKTNGDGEQVSVLARVADGCSDGYEAAVAREGAEERACLKQEIEEYLASEPELAGVFELLWQGVTNPAEIAQRLKMDEKAVVRARKRLDRRLARLRKKESCRPVERA